MKILVIMMAFFGLFGCNKKQSFEYQELIDKAIADLGAKTASHQAVWRFGEEDKWSLDQDEGYLIFTFPDKVVSCPAQIIGSFDSDKGTWMWAWHNEHIATSLKRDSIKLMELGKSKGYKQLTDPVWPCTENDAWEMAALATLHCNAQGAYRGPAGNVFVFMTFGEIKIKKKDL